MCVFTVHVLFIGSCYVDYNTNITKYRSMFIYAYFNLMNVWINVYGSTIFFSSFAITAIAMLSK